MCGNLILTQEKLLWIFYFLRCATSLYNLPFTKILNDNKDMLKQASGFNEYIFKKFLITVLSMKHKGFQEEREWRILCNSSIYMSSPNEILKEKE